MPNVISQELITTNDIIDIYHSDNTRYRLSKNIYQTWLQQNPDATATDLEAELESRLSGLTNRLDIAVYIHVYALQLPSDPTVPHLAILITRPGVEVAADWYVIDESY